MWLIKAIVPETSSNQLLLINSATYLLKISSLTYVHSFVLNSHNVILNPMTLYSV